MNPGDLLIREALAAYICMLAAESGKKPGSLSEICRTQTVQRKAKRLAALHIMFRFFTHKIIEKHIIFSHLLFYKVNTE